MPIKRADRHRRIARRIEFAERRPGGERSEDQYADRDMRHVEACRGEIEGIIEIAREGRALARPFLQLDCDEDDAEHETDGKAERQTRSLALFDRLLAECHGD